MSSNDEDDYDMSSDGDDDDDSSDDENSIFGNQLPTKKLEPVFGSTFVSNVHELLANNVSESQRIQREVDKLRKLIDTFMSGTENRSKIIDMFHRVEGKETDIFPFETAVLRFAEELEKIKFVSQEGVNGIPKFSHECLVAYLSTHGSPKLFLKAQLSGLTQNILFLNSQSKTVTESADGIRDKYELSSDIAKLRKEEVNLYLRVLSTMSKIK